MIVNLYVSLADGAQHNFIVSRRPADRSCFLSWIIFTTSTNHNEIYTYSLCCNFHEDGACETPIVEISTENQYFQVINYERYLKLHDDSV